MTKQITIIIAVLIIVALGGVAWYQYSLPRPSPQPAPQQLLGGDRDAHGCIGSAGYSWCETKNKCLRVWEEKCYEAEEASLAQVFSSQHNLPVAQTHVTVVALQNNFAAGSIYFGPTAGEAGAFLARLVNGTWIIDYEGNGSIDCPKIKALGYSQEILQGFCD